MSDIGDFLLGPEGQSLLRTLGRPNSDTTPNPYATAQQEAIQKYPYLGRLGAPIVLTTGEGPYESESYMPKAEDNPQPGNYTVQLRDKDLIKDPSKWSGILGIEGIDWMARQDPTYQKYASDFREMMTPEQLAQSRKSYERDVKNYGEERSFEDYLKGAQIQEYLRGYLFPDVIKGWAGPKGEGQYTPEQEKHLDQLKDYLMKPTPEIGRPPFWERGAMEVGRLGDLAGQLSGSKTFGQNVGDFAYNMAPKSNRDALLKAATIGMIPAVGTADNLMVGSDVGRNATRLLNGLDDAIAPTALMQRALDYLGRKPNG